MYEHQQHIFTSPRAGHKVKVIFPKSEPTISEIAKVTLQAIYVQGLGNIRFLRSGYMWSKHRRTRGCMIDNPFAHIRIEPINE